MIYEYSINQPAQQDTKTDTVIRVAQSERQDIAASPVIKFTLPLNVQEPYRNPLFYACHPYMITDKGSHVSSSLVASSPWPKHPIIRNSLTERPPLV